MSSYHAYPGPVPGTILWQVVADNTEHRVLPDAVMDIVCFDGKLLFAGPDTTATVMEVSPGSVTRGIRLAPGLAFALLGVAADELVNQRVALTDVVRIPARLLDAMHIAPDAALELLATALWLRAEPEADTLALAHSLDSAARIGMSVRETAEQHDISERTLRRLSGQVFGYGPKTLASIHRFQHALSLAHSGISFGQTAAIAHYADQAHLSREARRLGGATLSELVPNSTPLPPPLST